MGLLNCDELKTIQIFTAISLHLMSSASKASANFFYHEPNEGGQLSTEVRKSS